MRQMTLKEIHAAELQMLLLIDRFCQENRLTYYLAYGTLLGALRHGGFIPWDDDADIWMPSDSYEQLISQFEESERYRLIKPFDRRYGFSWAKIVDTSTAYENSYCEMPGDYGLSIDIFPLDLDRGAIIKKRAALLGKLRRLAWRNHKIAAKASIKDQVKYRLGGLTSWLPDSLVGKTAFEKYVLGVEPVSSNHCLNLHSRYPYERERMPTSYFSEGVYYPFEGEYLRIPERSVQVVETIYGLNWLEPKIDQRHACVFWREGCEPDELGE